jgi:hypothetical protein
MVLPVSKEQLPTLHIVKEVMVEAPLAITFQAVLAELGPEGEMPGGKPFPMVLEPWPGGRWFRDLGNNAGHLWGHVQVIKPPGLLELCGPMFMSFAATNHLQYRLTEEGAGTRLKITHSAIGQIPPEVFTGVGEGWEHGLKRIREIALRLKNKQ